MQIALNKKMTALVEEFQRTRRLRTRKDALYMMIEDAVFFEGKRLDGSPIVIVEGEKYNAVLLEKDRGYKTLPPEE